MGLALTHGRKAASFTARRITSCEPDRNWAVTFMLTTNRSVDGCVPHLAAEILLGRWQIGGQTDFGGGPVEGGVDGRQVQVFRQRGKGVAQNLLSALQ